MNLSEEQRIKLQKVFKAIDDKRLLYGQDEKESLFLHGMMLGMREFLEDNSIQVSGITGLWWYEELSEHKRQDGIRELKVKFGVEGKMEHILSGNKEGIKWVRQIINN